MEINLSNCRTAAQIEAMVKAALAECDIVAGPLEARRRFRREGPAGRMRTRTAFAEKKELSCIGPLHRNVLVYVAVREYYTLPEGKHLFSYEVTAC